MSMMTAPSKLRLDLLWFVGKRCKVDLHSGAKIVPFSPDVNRFLDHSAKLRIKPEANVSRSGFSGRKKLSTDQRSHCIRYKTAQLHVAFKQHQLSYYEHYRIAVRSLIV
jgi:hypothetical protein